MKKQDVIKKFRDGHKKMMDAIRQLDNRQMTEEKVLIDWTVKDILVHLSAWSREAVKEIDRVLKDKSIWPTLYNCKEGEDKFNEKVIRENKDKSLEMVIKEWKNSFESEMKKLEDVSKEEWLYQSKNKKWRDGSPVTVFSLYGYEYQGEQHEAAHATQIRKYFERK